MRHPRIALRALVIAMAALAIPVAGSAGTIGLYADQSGGTCSFSGNDTGPLTVYVVVKPDPAGIRGIRFAAPIPQCLGAVFVDEMAAPGALSIGESYNGISVAFPYCATEPTFALQINYYRSSTTPCCPFAIVEDPFVGMIEGVDCAYDQLTMTGVTSKFNADATCPCTDGQAPYPPHTPEPPDWMTWVSTGTALSWSPSGYDGDILEYDVYLGTDSTPDLVATVTVPTYQPPLPLLPSTQYFWRVVVRDVEGLATSGALWRFTTAVGNYPPLTPSNPSPADNAMNVPINLTLAWIAGDPDGSALKYDVYFGTVSPPPLVITNVVAASFARSGLNYATEYFWRVVARDPQGAETSGPEWRFTTRLVNSAPTVPIAIAPLPGATNVAIGADLQWNSTDIDGDVITYSVFFGTTNPPPLVQGNYTPRSLDVGLMAFSTVFYWQVVARDSFGASNTSPVWSFTTQANNPPTIPSNPQPPNNASGVSREILLAWSSADELPGLKYDVYFGTTPAPPLVSSNQTDNTFSPGLLGVGTGYYWRVVARDAQGLETIGPLWMFATVMYPAPILPSPPDNGFATQGFYLSWTVTDPMTYPILCDVYFGDTDPPPLVASGIGASGLQTLFRYTPNVTVVPGTRYYWKVYSYASFGGSMGPTWSFVGQGLGDVDRDGTIGTDDAACALQIAIGNSSCTAAGATNLADVDCVSGVTPRDALCIHRRAIGQTCLFCGESSTAGESALFPSLARSSFWQVGSTLYAVISVSGVPNLEAFSFWVRHPSNAPLVAAVRRDATGNFTALEMRTYSTHSRVGAYSLNGVNASATTDFIELRFQLGGTLTGMIYMDTFADDFAGAPSVTIAAASGGKGGGLPVIFSRFDAAPDGNGIRIGWEFQHDDAVDTYVIYRGVDGARPSLPVVQGPATEVSGSYLDQAVEPGRTYRYEMMVRASDGDEFRSQTVTVEMPGLDVALGANHPNPFNPQTTIPYVIPAGAPIRVRLAIYDTAGHLVRVLVDETQTGGARDVVWRGDAVDGKPVTSGVYFAVLQAGNDRRTRKLVLLK